MTSLAFKSASLGFLVSALIEKYAGVEPSASLILAAFFFVISTMFKE